MRWIYMYLLVLLIGVLVCISTYTFGASFELAALSGVLESLTNRCVKLVNCTSI